MSSYAVYHLFLIRIKMAGGKRHGGSATSVSRSLKWQSSNRRTATPVGKKPLPDPTTVSQVFVMIVMHVCRKIVLFEPEIKIGVYFIALVFGSLITDFFPLPRTYFSSKHNFFNVYFVKLGWGWTLLMVGIFMFLTSWTYCCGNKDRVRRHMYRSVVGTVSWFVWTKTFVYIENVTASCLNSKFTTRSSCIKGGSRWIGFDISGHAFLLIYCSLFLMEEAKCIRGWERIGELIRYLEYDDDNPLKKLTTDEFTQLSSIYERFTPYIKVSFISLTALSLLWDVMLVITILYYHSMVQKVAGGIFAVLTWFSTYRWWYRAEGSPGLPGDGPFNYCDIPPQKSRRMSFSGYPVS